MKVRVCICTAVLALAAVALIAPASSLGAARTTDPGLAPVTLYVTITDKGITYTMWQSYSEEGHVALIVANGLKRGEVAIFVVRNHGKKQHNFEAFGKKTRTLAPGATAHFKVALLHRGTFPYASTLDKNKRAFHGVLTVY